MAETATITADSSPSEILSSLTPKEKVTWRQTGELPERPAKEAPKEKVETKETPAESSPAAKTEVTEQKETPAESSAAPVVAKEHKPNKGAEARIKELLSENKRLAAENDDLRKRPVAETKKAEEVVIPRRNDVDAKTGQPLYATDEAWLDARDKAIKEIAKQETRQELVKQENERRTAEQTAIVQKRWLNSIKIAVERNPDWAKKVGVDDKTGKYGDAALKSIRERGVLDQFILDSEIGAVLLEHFAGNQAEVDRIQELGAYAAARELTRLEDKLLSEITSAPKETKADAPTKEVKPKVTSAPAPAASVNGRNTAPADETEAAVKAGDFSSFRKRANEEEAAKRKAS